ncbi:hypothetical protein ASPVEDRAFT_82593 [Aspergillus versicolor CBS 583.65]|uniref:Uncharacterized protein n=1 Tax=Aspergillus versicolor CBS 583.65 TaxID=1036611 RepID=A0A1L9PHR3_ASPVE|nr:uncharacterized protein ASPVEDRAFT_82593 [Aspergillus versicolor CBS 583.65]OJJ01048.1 hypothetical protein ASPVEDRAFT_82593 [Aspergillus versicolor CBS 583.65]
MEFKLETTSSIHSALGPLMGHLASSFQQTGTLEDRRIPALVATTARMKRYPANPPTGDSWLIYATSSP